MACRFFKVQVICFTFVYTQSPGTHVYTLEFNYKSLLSGCTISPVELQTMYNWEPNQLLSVDLQAFLHGHGDFKIVYELTKYCPQTCRLFLTNLQTFIHRVTECSLLKRLSKHYRTNVWHSCIWLAGIQVSKIDQCNSKVIGFLFYIYDSIVED